MQNSSYFSMFHIEMKLDILAKQWRQFAHIQRNQNFLFFCMTDDFLNWTTWITWIIWTIWTIWTIWITWTTVQCAGQTKSNLLRSWFCYQWERIERWYNLEVHPFMRLSDIIMKLRLVSPGWIISRIKIPLSFNCFPSSHLHLSGLTNVAILNDRFDLRWLDMRYEIWYMRYEIWNMKYEIWNMKYEIWNIN
jgi:hypothetical protein